jgi:chromate transport protein ChrA
MLSAGLIFFLLSKTVQDIWVRFSVYISAIFASVMEQKIPELEILTHWLMDIYLLILIVVVSLVVRITRKSKFRVTTQDLLVLLFVIATVFFIDVKLIEYITIRLFCLVYALEYLINRDFYKFRLSRYSAAVSGVIIVAIVLPTL